MAVNLVNLENVRKAHGTTVVLDDVSLGVADGERIGVVGRNGSGKSTLLRVLADAERVDAGRVTHTGGLTVGRERSRPRQAWRSGARKRGPCYTPDAFRGT